MGRMITKNLALTLLILTPSISSLASEEIASKFGTLRVVNDSMVEFNNKPIKLEGDEIQLIDIVKIFNFTDYDIVLLRRKGNESCLIDFNLIVVTELGSNATEPFGTCLDLTEAYQNDSSVIITIPMRTEGLFKKITYTNDFPTKPPEKITKPNNTALLEEKYTTDNPRRKFIGKTNNYHFAMYIEKWRQLVEMKVSNSDTLKALRNIGVYGKVQLIISVKSDGSIYNIETNESSGNLRLDETLVNLIEQSSPFEKFSDEMIKDADVISFVRTFSFSPE